MAGTAGDWTDDGACTTSDLAPGEFVKMTFQSKAVPATQIARASVVPNPKLAREAAAATEPARRNSRFFTW